MTEEDSLSLAWGEFVLSLAKTFKVDIFVVWLAGKLNKYK